MWKYYENVMDDATKKSRQSRVNVQTDGRNDFLLVKCAAVWPADHGGDARRSPWCLTVCAASFSPQHKAFLISLFSLLVSLVLVCSVPSYTQHVCCISSPVCCWGELQGICIPPPLPPPLNTCEQCLSCPGPPKIHNHLLIGYGNKPHHATKRSTTPTAHRWLWVEVIAVTVSVNTCCLYSV